MKSFLGDKTKGRGLQNNNPGFIIRTSIEWQGKLPTSSDAQYEQFYELRYGLRAMLWQVYLDTIERKLNLFEFIKKYSGRADGNPKLLNFVSQKTGIAPIDYVQDTKNQLIGITKALVQYFNADANLITETDYDDAFNLLKIKQDEQDEEPTEDEPMVVQQSSAGFWVSVAMLAGGILFS